MRRYLLTVLAVVALLTVAMAAPASAAPRFDQLKVHARGALNEHVRESFPDFQVSARGSGVEATGIVRFGIRGLGSFSAHVECLYVDGDFAMVVARIRGQSPFPEVSPFIIVVVEDGTNTGRPDAGFGAAWNQDLAIGCDVELIADREGGARSHVVPVQKGHVRIVHAR
jgi:hypothetical protein